MIAVLTALAVAAAPTNKLAVMPLAAKNLAAETVEILDLLLVAELEASGAYTVVRPADVDAMLGLERLKDAAGCDDVSCATDIASALGVQRLMTGTAGRLGDELVVQLTLINVEAQQVERRGQATATADERSYRDAVKRAVADVLGRPPPPRAEAKMSRLTLRFDTTEEARAFDVRLITSDGSQHACPTTIDSAHGCTLTNLALGDARIYATSAPLHGFEHRLVAKDDRETIVYSLRNAPSLGSMISWAYGGMALVAGIALTSVGLAVEKNGFVYGGIPTMLAGGGLIALGFTFDGQVAVATQHLREDGKSSWWPFF